MTQGPSLLVRVVHGRATGYDVICSLRTRLSVLSVRLFQVEIGKQAGRMEKWLE